MSLRELLDRFRSHARTEREKGTYFERLTQTWLKHAPTQRGLYSRVLTFAEWAKERGEDGTELWPKLGDGDVRRAAYRSG